MSGILSAFIGRVAGVVTDAYFNLVTLLLPGNGTNGAQNNTFLDSSTNNFSITRNGNTTQGTFSPFSQTGWSNFFNGNSDYLNAPAGSAFAFGTGSWTVEAWVYVTSLASEILLFDTRSSVSTAGVGCRIATDGTLSYSGSANNALTTTAITTNTWNHVAFVYDGTTLSGYINGSRGGTATPSFNITQNNGVIGRVGFSASGYMAGYISNLRVVKGTAVYSGSSFTVPTAALTAITNTSLLTCQSNRFIDNSSNAFAITVNSTPSVQAFSPFAPTAAYSAATVGGSGYFDGTGDYLSVASNAAFGFGTADYTIEAWVYPTSIRNGENLVYCTDTTGGLTLLYTQTTLAIGRRATSTDLIATYTVATNAWTHIAVSRQSGTTRLYANGVLLTSTTTSYNYPTGQAGIGDYPTIGNLGVIGYLSGVRVTKQALYTGSTYTVPTAPTTTTSQGATAGNVSLLTNFTNAGITDATAKNVLETVGNAQISTTQSKFGGSSISFDGTGDNLVIPSSPNVWFGSGAFSIEMWLYPNNASSEQMLLSGNDTGSLFLGMNIDGANRIALGRKGVAVDNFVSYTYSTGAWIYLAVTRDSSNNIKFFVNGSQVGSTGTNANSFTNSVMNIGFEPTQKYLNGYIDDLRITKGIARTITASPTAAFPLQ